MRLQLHFPDSRWKQVAENWNAWWAGGLERALVILECIEPQDDTTPHYASTFLGNYGPQAPAEELLALFAPRLRATHYLGDAFPRFWPNFGPGIVAARAGARLHAVADTTWFSPGFQRPIHTLHVESERGECSERSELYERSEQYERSKQGEGDKASDPWWPQVINVTEAAVRQWGEQLSVGFSDLGGNLDILAHLRGTEQLLLDLVDEPEEGDRLVRETNQLWQQCYDELYALTQKSRGITCWGPCWSQGRGYLLQSDFSYMISPKMFERFVLPDLEECCQVLEYGFYHLDGKGQLPHLEMLLAIEKLRGIQWVPGDGQPPAEKWLPLLKRILESGKLCQVYVGAEGAKTILRELGGKGLLLVINETLTPEQGAALLDEIRLINSAECRF